MAGSRKDKGMWEEDRFEDISSHSRGPSDGRDREVLRPDFNRSRQSGRSSGQPRQEWELPQWEFPERANPRRSRPERDRFGESRSGYGPGRSGDSRQGSGRSGPGRPGNSRPGASRSGASCSESGRDRRGRTSRPQERRRSRKPMSNGARRAMVAFTVLVMAASTALLAIFLLFKVSEIQITGDTVEGCQNADVLAVCGYKTGDNLFFLSTRDKEEKLKEQFPYIEEVKISRHLPGTLEIRLTGAKAAACASSGESWLYLSAGGKILERRNEPLSGALQVSGLPLEGLEPGQDLRTREEELRKQAALSSQESPASSEGGEGSGQASPTRGLQQAADGYNAIRAYREIITRLEEQEASQEFTSLDLTDLSNILLLYRGQVEFRLGSVVELGYKIDLGLRSIAKWEAENPGTAIRGVMDLSYADQSKKAFFTEGEIGSAAPAGNGSSAAPAETTPSPSPDPRGEDIPTQPYTGGDSGSAGDDSPDDGTGDTGDGWTDDGTGDTGDGWTDDGTGDTGDGWSDDGTGDTGDGWSDDDTDGTGEDGTEGGE